LMVEGVAATRGSIVFISLGIATIINVFFLKVTKNGDEN